MSINFHVFTRRERIPTASDWLKAMHGFGFPTQIGADFDPLSFSGYLPCPDDLTGFELYVEPFSEMSVEIGLAGMQAVTDADTMITFRFSGRETDLAAATAASASLAAMTNGVLFDSESGHFVAATSAIAWARHDAYQPIAVHRPRASRRKSRIRLSTVLRLLLIVAIAAWVLFFRK